MHENVKERREKVQISRYGNKSEECATRSKMGPKSSFQEKYDKVCPKVFLKDSYNDHGRFKSLGEACSRSAMLNRVAKIPLVLTLIIERRKVQVDFTVSSTHMYFFCVLTFEHDYGNICWLLTVAT